MPTINLKRLIFKAVAFSAILFLSYLVLFRGYERPASFFWDENYHVAHAQKYLNHTYFMEPHPPLGKLVIAAGEWLFDYNADDSQFIGTDHAKDAPARFSFAGYRFFPVLLAMFCPPLIFLILRGIGLQPFFSGVGACLFLLDNSMVVHMRGAMLEGTQIFFIALFLLAVVHLAKATGRSRLLAVVCGFSFACVITTKINGLIIVLLIPVALYSRFRRGAPCIAPAIYLCTMAAVTFVTVWQIHFSLGQSINTELPDKGWYQASPAFKEIVLANQQNDPRSFPVMIRDSLSFVTHYARGVPSLNLCRNAENGSPAWLWPIGGRSIDYRWERKDNLTSYLYLQANPVVYAFSLLGIIFGTSMLVAGAMGVAVPHLPWVASFTMMYLAYMATMLTLRRVMYLYHYFIPLIFGLLAFSIVLSLAPKICISLKSQRTRGLLSTLCVTMAATSFFYLSPLTYSMPISDADIKERALLNAWDLRCPTCDITNEFARPICDPKIKRSTELDISGVKPDLVYQEWGEPQVDKSVGGAPLEVAGQRFQHGLGVHARSELSFILKSRFQRFKASVGLSDASGKDGKQGSVVFIVRADDSEVWRSEVIHHHQPAVQVDVSLAGVNKLTLEVRDGGDDNSNDHALWLDPVLEK